jgi:iron(III) transport system ATP-binding protein
VSLVSDGLTLESLSHAFGGKRVLHDVSLSVALGELVCLVGPSGCGKSTTMRLAAGLEVVQEGRVLIGAAVMGTRGRHVPPEKRGVGMVFQDYALFPHLSVRDNVAFGLDRLPAGERKARALATLARVGMTAHIDAFPATLSGGEQQRVALARALAPEPALMLLDEPFSGLDLQLRDQVRDDTVGLMRRAGTATLMVTHDPGEAMQMADRIAVMRAGRIAQIGRPAELYAQPVDAFVAAFFGPVNRFRGEARDGAVATPFGRLPAPGLAGPVEVVVRPEAMQVSGEGAAATVLDSRPLGALGRVCLRFADLAEREFHALVQPEHLPKPGSTVHIAIAPGRGFVFPAGD